MRGKRQRLAWYVPLSVLVPLAAALFMSAGGPGNLAPGAVRAQASNEISVLAPASPQPLGMTFSVDIAITRAEVPYVAFQVAVEFDSAVLGFVPTDDLSGDTVPESWHYTALGETALDVTVFDVSGDPAVKGGGSGRISGTTTATGTAIQSQWTCLQSGVSTLHLVTPAEDPTFGSSTFSDAPPDIQTGLVDAQITCQEGAAPVPTVTPGGGVTPAPTPMGPFATAVPLPPGMEVAPLAAGCNPVTSTYPNLTPVQTIAGAVIPAGNLVSLWMSDAGTWKAFSPQFPEVSDLAQIDLLDVVFACVGGPGDFVRPVV